MRMLLERDHEDTKTRKEVVHHAFEPSSSHQRPFLGLTTGRGSTGTVVHSDRWRTSMPSTYGTTMPNGHSSESTGPMTRAGLPATAMPAGTSAVTTLPAPTSAFSPMVMSGSNVTLTPIRAPF